MTRLQRQYSHRWPSFFFFLDVTKTNDEKETNTDGGINQYRLHMTLFLSHIKSKWSRLSARTAHKNLTLLS